MIELCATHFCARSPRSPRSVTFANRTTERAADLAARFSARSVALPDLPQHIAQHDIIVTCTASPLPIVGKGLIERALKLRRHRPILIVDLAVPRDVELEVGSLGDVFLYTVDDLGRIVQEGLENRQSAVTQAEAIITEGVNDFMQWLQTRKSVPTIRALRDHAERLRRNEMERAAKALARGDDPAMVLEALSHGITNKLLHAPTAALHGAESEERERLETLLTRLYSIPRE